MDFSEISQFTEDEARTYLEKIRWPDGPACPHCGDMSVVLLRGKATRPGVYKCRGCRRQFTVTVGTIFHRSHIPLRKWVMGFHLVCASKKGISALQLQRQLGLKSYKSAWHMAHRIRHAMESEPLASMLSGQVEADETYVGGKPRKGTGEHRYTPKIAKKTTVFVAVERGGRARTRVIKTSGKEGNVELRETAREFVSPDSQFITDGHSAYPPLASEFAGGHHTVNHSANEFARGDIHSNTSESFFALLKRGVYGTFHHVSPQHLQRYCDEFEFRWSHREITDVERAEIAIKMADGRRLTYRDTIKGTTN